MYEQRDDVGEQLVVDEARRRAARVLYDDLNASPVEMDAEQLNAEAAKIRARLATMTDDEATALAAIYEGRYPSRPTPAPSPIEEAYLAGRLGRLYTPQQFRRLMIPRPFRGVRSQASPRSRRPRSRARARAPTRRSDDPDLPPLGRLRAALVRLLGGAR